MAFVSDMVDELRLLLNDPTDTQVPITTKKLYLNRGIARLWPKIWRVLVDQQTVVANSRDYPYAVGPSAGMVLGVEMQINSVWTRYTDYDLLLGDEDLAGIINFTGYMPTAGTLFRVRYALPCSSIVASTYANMQSEVWVGPDRAMKLPVLYAMGMITLGKLDDRQDALRYSTTQATNGVTDNDLMTTAQMWFGQFEQELDDMAFPLPIAKD